MGGELWTQTRFQDRLVAKLGDIETNGHGLHKHRSRRGALKQAYRELAERGYSEAEARAIINDARDMFELELVCEEDGT